MKNIYKVGCLGILCTLLSKPVFAEGTVDAVLGPAIGMQAISEQWGSGMRTQYSLDFARISAGVSLNAFYGTGLGYSDYGASLRIFGNYNFFSNLEELSFWFGAGAGARYVFDVSEATTDLPSSATFGRIHISPFTRVIYDFNGWVAPFLDLSYDIGVGRWGRQYTGLDNIKGGFVAALGIAIDIER